MPLLPARHYESEITQFIRGLLKDKPQLETEQKKSRAIWWDKTPAQLDARQQMDQGLVPQRGYVYGSGNADPRSGSVDRGNATAKRSGGVTAGRSGSVPAGPGGSAS
jgi:hypothetical protein